MAFSGVNAENKGSPCAIEKSISHEYISTFDIPAEPGAGTWLKVVAIMQLDFISRDVPVKYPDEGLSAYGWEKDKRNRIFTCRSNC